MQEPAAAAVAVEATTVVNYSKEQVSKLLEEGRLREGVVLVNYRPAVVRRRKVFPEKSEKNEETIEEKENERNNEEKERREEGQVKERVRSGGRRRKKVKVKKRKKKIGGGTVQNTDQASKTGHGIGLISNSNPYFKDLNFPQLPFDKSADFSKFDAQFGGAVAPSKAQSQGRLISGAQATSTTSPTGSRSRLLLPKRRLFGSKATELGLQPLQGLNELTPLSFPRAQAPVQHQSQLSFNVKEKPRTLLSRKKVRLRPSRVLFGHKSQLVSRHKIKKPQVQEPQFFTNANIRFKPPQFQPSPPPLNSSPAPVGFQSSQSSGSQDPTQFQLAPFQPPESLVSRFQKSQSQGQLLRGLDGSYTINTDL